jgi:hypothetical protein
LLQTLLETGFDEHIEVAIEYRLRIAGLDIGAQILDARLIEYIGADLAAPADIGLAVLDRLLRFAAASASRVRTGVRAASSWLDRDSGAANARSDIAPPTPVGRCVRRTAESVLLTC